MHRSIALLPVATLVSLLSAAAAQDAPALPNAGFEAAAPATGLVEGWTRGIAPGTEGDAQIDDTVACEGRQSLRISDSTPTEAYRYVLVNSDWIDVVPETTYVIGFHARGRGVGRCFVGVAFEGAGEHRQALPIGDYEWTELACRVTTPPGSRRLSVQFLADGTVDALWIDSVSLELSAIQLANIVEARFPRTHTGWFPPTPGPVPEHLVVADLTSQSTDTCGLLVALQGIVNRDGPRLYLINQTNPPRYDDIWLAYMREKGYTVPE